MTCDICMEAMPIQACSVCVYKTCRNCWGKQLHWEQLPDPNAYRTFETPRCAFCRSTRSEGAEERLFQCETSMQQSDATIHFFDTRDEIEMIEQDVKDLYAQVQDHLKKYHKISAAINDANRKMHPQECDSAFSALFEEMQHMQWAGELIQMQKNRLTNLLQTLPEKADSNAWIPFCLHPTFRNRAQALAEACKPYDFYSLLPERKQWLDGVISDVAFRHCVHEYCKKKESIQKVLRDMDVSAISALDAAKS